LDERDDVQRDEGEPVSDEIPWTPSMISRAPQYVASATAFAPAPLIRPATPSIEFSEERPILPRRKAKPVRKVEVVVEKPSLDEQGLCTKCREFEPDCECNMTTMQRARR
jgi:hypothetical protein